jgi:histone-lysine N-methyltransferase SETD3
MSLECAFEWLHLQYTGIFDAVVGMIAEDQEERLPLNWAVLVEDWDTTYWTVWIYITWLLWARDGEAFRQRHATLSTWMVNMNL